MVHPVLNSAGFGFIEHSLSNCKLLTSHRIDIAYFTFVMLRHWQKILESLTEIVNLVFFDMIRYVQIIY